MRKKYYFTFPRKNSIISGIVTIPSEACGDEELVGFDDGFVVKLPVISFSFVATNDVSVAFVES